METIVASSYGRQLHAAFDLIAQCQKGRHSLSPVTYSYHVAAMPPPPSPAVLRSLNIVDLPASHCPFPPPSPFKETPFYVRYFTHIQLVHRRITNSSWFPSVSSPRGRALPLPLLHFRTLSPRAPSPILHSHKENPKTAAATA